MLEKDSLSSRQDPRTGMGGGVRNNSGVASQETCPHAEIGKMKKFTCVYTNADGHRDNKCPEKKIEAASAEEAAHIYAEQNPSDEPKISVYWGLLGKQVVDNPLRLPSSTRSSEISEVVSYLERIHYWIRFMGVVLLIQIILAVILMFFWG